jgi:hypothetical protein
MKDGLIIGDETLDDTRRSELLSGHLPDAAGSRMEKILKVK